MASIAGNVIEGFGLGHEPGGDAAVIIFFTRLKVFVDDTPTIDADKAAGRTSSAEQLGQIREFYYSRLGREKLTKAGAAGMRFGARESVLQERTMAWSGIVSG